MLLVYVLVYVHIDALFNWAFQLPREQARVSRTEARASITEARLSEFSQALTDVRNTMADISINQKIQTDAVTKALEKMLEMSNDHLKAMDNLIKRIENLEPKRELWESI